MQMTNEELLTLAAKLLLDLTKPSKAGIVETVGMSSGKGYITIDVYFKEEE